MKADASSPPAGMARAKQTALLIIGFLIGVAVMGLQMAITRPLTPHFGSDIYVWSAVIAVTMMAMMTGYYGGGRLVDLAPRSEALGVFVILAALYLAAAPALMQVEFLADPDPFFPGLKRSALAWLSTEIPSTPLGALIAAFVLVFPPFTLISFFSPYCIRLILFDAAHGGRASGSVYAITTFGNVIGVLGTALWLMTFMGSQAIIYLFAGWLAACGVGLILLRTSARVHA
ncbi:MAG: fused MFS/spermidine synthase [Hyphomonadaceae bacterium]